MDYAHRYNKDFKFIEIGVYNDNGKRSAGSPDKNLNTSSDYIFKIKQCLNSKISVLCIDRIIFVL